MRVHANTAEQEVAVSSRADAFATSRPAAAPRLSVVLTAVGTPDDLPSRLYAASGWAASDVEVTLSVAADTAAGTALARAYPAFAIVVAPPGTPVGELRRLGAAQATGDVVAFVDQAVDADWIDTLAPRRLTSESVAQAAPGAGSRVLSGILPVEPGADPAPLLASLAASTLPRDRWELVVVDDGAAAATLAAAAPLADRVVRLPDGPFGAAYAKNRGVESATTGLLAFVHAGIRVQPSTLERLLGALVSEPRASAVVGVVDDAPATDGLVSHYLHLRDHRRHHREDWPWVAFWSGCGALSLADFVAAARFDEWRFQRPSLEDAEFGVRLRRLGHRVVRSPHVRVTAARETTLGELLAGEVWDRGVPWRRILASQIGLHEIGPQAPEPDWRTYTVCAWVALASPWWGRPWGLGICLAALLFYVAGTRAQLAYFRRARGLAFAAATLPVDLLASAVRGVGVLLGWALHETLGEPNPDATAQAFAEVGAEQWPPARTRPPASTT